MSPYVNRGMSTPISGSAMIQKLVEKANESERTNVEKIDAQQVRIVIDRPEALKVHSLGNQADVSTQTAWTSEREEIHTKYPVSSVSGRKIIVASVRRCLSQCLSAHLNIAQDDHPHNLVHLIRCHLSHPTSVAKKSCIHGRGLTLNA